MAGRIARHRTQTGGGSSLNDPQCISGDLTQRHFLAFHNSISRLQRIKFQLSVNASLYSEPEPQQTNQQPASCSARRKLQTTNCSVDEDSGGIDHHDDEQKQENQQEHGTATNATGKNHHGCNSHHHGACQKHVRPLLCGTDNCEIRMITDPAHPAFRQCGLFATKKIVSGALIMPYAGLVTLVGTVPSSQTYIMSYGGDDSDLGIDAEYFGNYARFANDPRGTGLTSNAFAVMRPTRLGETFTAIVSKRIIVEGEEILLDYGKRHRLSKVPLISRKGTLLSHGRPVVPFRKLSSSSPSSSSCSSLSVRRNETEDDDDGQEDRTSSSTSISSTAALSPLSWLSTQNDQKTRLHSARSMWQCLQCGAWNDGGNLIEAPRAIAICCSVCEQPRSSDTVPAVAMMLDALPATGRRRQRDGEQKILPAFPTKGVVSPTLTLERPAVIDDIKGNPRTGEGTSRMTKEECSVPASWPLHFPFISWQVWDTEVSMFAVNASATPILAQSSIVVAEVDDAGGLDEKAKGNNNSNNNNGTDNANGGAPVASSSSSCSSSSSASSTTTISSTTTTTNRGTSNVIEIDHEGDEEVDEDDDKDGDSDEVDDDDDEVEQDDDEGAHKGIFCSTGARVDDEIGVAGGLLVDKNWSNLGTSLQFKFLGFSGERSKDNKPIGEFEFGDETDEGGDEGECEETEEEEGSRERDEESSSCFDGEGDDLGGDDDDDDEEEQDDDDEDEEEDEGSEGDIPLTISSISRSFTTPFFIINLRFLKVTHRPFVHLPSGELDVVPMVKLPHPPNNKSYLGEKFLDMFFYPTNEAQHLRVAAPRMRHERMTRLLKKQEKQHRQRHSTNEPSLPSSACSTVPLLTTTTTRTFLSREAFEFVPESSFVDAPPNATLEIVRDPVGFIYIAIVAVDQGIPRWTEVVI